MQAPWIFLSYRHNDSGHRLAARVAFELETSCGEGSVFYDAGSLKAGVEWDEVILHVLSQCNIVIVLIEKNWPIERLQDSQDWVRREIRESLKRNKLIIPLCFDGAEMPGSESLPPDIRELNRRQGYFIDSRSERVFKAAMAAVSDELRSTRPSEIVILREREPWWHEIEHNDWSVYLDEKPVYELEGAATSGSVTVQSGVHSLRVRWSERQKMLYMGGASTSGRSSSGTTEPVEVTLRPGRYSYTLTKGECRSLFRRYFSLLVLHEDVRPRSLTFISFEPLIS